MAVKASERVKRYQNPNGPTISTVERKVIEQDGLYFKDIDGTGTVSAVNDWRLTPAERAEAYVKVLTTSEKIGQIFTSDWRMGPKYPSPRLAANGHKPVADESGLLDEAPVNVSDSIFGSQSLPSTSDMVRKSFNRHVILRESPTPEDLADYLNQLQYLTETCDHFVPMQVMSNSRNENGEVVFGMNDATGVFATYPGTLALLLPSRAPHASTSSTSSPTPSAASGTPAAEEGLHVHGRLRHRPPLAAHLRHLWRGPGAH